MLERGHYGFENLPRALYRSLANAKASLLYDLDYSVSCLYLKFFSLFFYSSTLNVSLAQGAVEGKKI